MKTRFERYFKFVF